MTQPVVGNRKAGRTVTVCIRFREMDHVNELDGRVAEGQLMAVKGASAFGCTAGQADIASGRRIDCNIATDVIVQAFGKQECLALIPALDVTPHLDLANRAEVKITNSKVFTPGVIGARTSPMPG